MPMVALRALRAALRGEANGGAEGSEGSGGTEADGGTEGSEADGGSGAHDSSGCSWQLLHPAGSPPCPQPQPEAADTEVVADCLRRSFHCLTLKWLLLGGKACSMAVLGSGLRVFLQSREVKIALNQF